MNIVMILLRLVHIGAGVFWAGAAVMIAAFVEPAVKESGPEGGRFMQRLVRGQRLSTYMSLSSLATALSGLILYWPVSGHLSVQWLTSGPGLTLTIGSVAGLLAFAVAGQNGQRLQHLLTFLSAGLEHLHPPVLEGLDLISAG